MTLVVACRRALDGVGSMAACGDIGDMVVLTAFGALHVPSSSPASHRLYERSSAAVLAGGRRHGGARARAVVSSLVTVPGVTRPVTAFETRRLIGAA